jgi:hypothetical protein
VIAALLALTVLGWVAQGLRVVGEIPSGLPKFAMPPVANKKTGARRKAWLL